MQEYRIDFKCPRYKKIVSLGSDWAFEVNEVLYCPACGYPAFKLVATYSEFPYQPLARDGTLRMWSDPATGTVQLKISRNSAGTQWLTYNNNYDSIAI
uniref:Uncharacterized protein n=1 Tax=viral metagenome TaxID=1070528 RepID=A0A6H1ZBB7_9ZZZZ